MTKHKKKTLSPEEIRRIRTSCGMTQEEFARHIGVSFPTINRWENGKHTPSQLAVRRLLEIA